jgi:hypothetical protein
MGALAATLDSAACDKAQREDPELTQDTIARLAGLSDRAALTRAVGLKRTPGAPTKAARTKGGYAARSTSRSLTRSCERSASRLTKSPACRRHPRRRRR